MSRFVYKATNLSGQIIEGKMEADNPDIVVERLQSQDLIPIKIKEKGKERLSSIKSADVLSFTQQLSSLISGGMPLERCLIVLEGLTKDCKLKMAISEIKDGIRNGERFSFNLAKYPQLFSRFYISMVEIGEASGVLDLTLERLADFATKEDELRGYIKSIMIYPLIMTIFGGLSIIIILTFVVPRFILIFKELGQTLPLPTVLLINLSKVIVHWWWFILILIFGVILGLKWCSMNKTTRYAMDRLRIKLPIVGQLIEMIIANKFASNLSTLLRGGVPLLDALIIVKDAVGNMVIEEAIVQIHDSLKKGEKFGYILKQSQVFPDLVVHMVSCGEESGNLDEMLEKTAKHYETQTRNKLRGLIALIEPIMILIMGIIVAFIVASILLPIFGMSDLMF